MNTFKISDVSREQRPLTTATLQASFQDLIEASVEASGTNFGGSGSYALTRTKSILNPFARAVHESFSKHYPLVLSPDDVWLAIAQGFALHVGQHHEALRKQFVAHEGSANITIIRDHFRKGSPDNDWQGAFAEFSDKIGESIGAKKRDLLVCRFSTTGPVERAASEVVLLGAMKHYFDYTVLTRCGIPELTLLGSIDDWRDIERRAATLAEYEGCGTWLAVLGPVLAEFSSAVNGNPHADFWRSFYKWQSGSGGPYINGAINVFFPYLCDEKDGDLRPNRTMLEWAKGINRTFGGTHPDKLPLGVSKVPFEWKYLGTELPMEFIGGFVGVAQDKTSLAVRPAIGWAIKDAEAEIE